LNVTVPVAFDGVIVAVSEMLFPITTWLVAWVTSEVQVLGMLTPSADR
jgi:hypothetical protein